MCNLSYRFNYKIKLIKNKAQQYFSVFDFEVYFFELILYDKCNLNF